MASRSDKIRRVTLSVRCEEGSLWAEVQEMPGCFAAGDSFIELLEALAEAIGQWMSDSDVPQVVRIVDVRGDVPLTPDRKTWSRELAISV